MFREEEEIRQGGVKYRSPLSGSCSADVQTNHVSFQKRYYGCCILQMPLHLLVLNVPFSTFHFRPFLQMVPLILMLSDPVVELPDIVQQPRNGPAVTVPEKLVT